jgi:hypothetical protein
MDKKNTLSFALSYDELIVLLQYFKRPEMPGLNTAPLQELSEQERKMMITVAERALLARGFLVIGGNSKLKMIDPVIALVGPCIESEKTLIVKFDSMYTPNQSIFFHTARKMRVMHSTPISGIHQFIAVEDDKAFLQSILVLSQIGDYKKTPCENGKIRLDAFEAIRAKSQEAGENRTAQSLIDIGLSQTTANLLVKCLASPIAYITFDYNNQSLNIVEGFSIFIGNNTVWLFEPSDQDGNFSVSTSSSDEIITRIKKLITQTNP